MSMQFKEVACAFNEIEKISSRLAMTHELAQLLKKATADEARLLAYLSLGTLNPPYLGTQFALAQKTMSKIVARILAVSPEQIEQEMQQRGDLGSVVEHYEWQAANALTLQQVYDALCELEKIGGTGSQEKKAVYLETLLAQVDPLSAKYIVRIVLGTLRLGFSDMTLVDALSWMEVGDKSLRPVLEHAYNVCADSGLLAYTLKTEGAEGIKHMRIHVGIPIRPAAAERLASAQEIIEKLGPCVVEPKLDGFRLQVHISNIGKEPLIRFFSRNLLDMSAMFPEFVQACKKLPVSEVIIDGEAIVYDPNTGTFVSFQETVKRRRKHGIEELISELPLQLNVFDIMYLDGKSLLHSEQKTRRALLKKLFDTYTQQQQAGNPEVKGVSKGSEQLSVFATPCKTDLVPHEETQTIQMIQEVFVTTPQELETYFTKEIAAGLEGVVVKKQDAQYQAGKRNFNWIKLKYQASEKLQDTLDVVILGYYPGKGKRASFGIGAFLVGIFNSKKDCFETVAKIGTGLTDHEWIALKKQCDSLAVHTQPKNVVCAPELAPTVWISPELVCEVLADEITNSPLHTAGKHNDDYGLALRFPRFVKYRSDKSATQTTTAQELKILQNRPA